MTTTKKNNLRRNPTEVQATVVDINLPYNKIIYIVLQTTLQTVLNIFSKAIIFDNTKCGKQIMKFIWNTCQCCGEI